MQLRVDTLLVLIHKYEMVLEHQTPEAFEIVFQFIFSACKNAQLILGRRSDFYRLKNAPLP